MAIYRNIQMSFWTDTKVIDDFNPEDKLLFLYLLTNPHTNLCGCYEISISQMVLEVGYPKEKIKEILLRLEMELNVIRFDEKTREVLIVNWYKHNWTESEKFRKPLFKEITEVKNDDFREYLTDLFNGIDTVSIGYRYGIDTVSEEENIGIDTTVTVTDTVTDTVLDNTETIKKPKEKKHKYGEYGHVLLTDRQYENLIVMYGNEKAVTAGIEKVDKYCQSHGKTYKDYNLVLQDWGIDAPKIKPEKKKPANKESPKEPQTDPNAGLDKCVIVNEDENNWEEFIKDKDAHPFEDGWRTNDDGYWCKV